MNSTVRIALLAIALVAAIGAVPGLHAQRSAGVGSPAVHDSASAWSLERRVGGGAGTLFGSEANPRGAHLQLALSAGRQGGALRLRPESETWVLTEQSLAPCVFALEGRCFQTARRDVISVGLAVEARLPFLRDGDLGPYLAAGVGAYHARAALRRYASCVPGALCTDSGDSYTYSETSPGVHLALGATMRLGPVPAYWEAGWHRTSRRDPTGDARLERLSGYTLLPFSLGVRW